MSTRQSALAARPSHMGGSSGRSQTSQPSSSLRLLEKRQEYEAVSALDEITTDMIKTLEQLAKQGNIMADGGKAVAAVMSNWPNVLRVISLFAKDSTGSTVVQQQDGELSTGGGDLPRLVRIDTAGLANGSS